MESLLRNALTAHYRLPPTSISNISKSTDLRYFELKDDITLIYTTVGSEVAKCSNIETLQITVINFESFFYSLKESFVHGKENCDLIVYDNNHQYIVFCELTDTASKYIEPYRNNKGQQPGKKQNAISQLLNTLKVIMQVPEILNDANSFRNRHCCFFSKQAKSPSSISATTAFGRLSTITTQGFRMANSDIEAFGFEFWEFYDNQIYKFHQ